MAERCVVTGGAGVIGTQLVNQLVARHDQVRVIDLLRRPSTIPSAVDYIQGDLVEVGPEAVSTFDPTVVFHLAASFERSEEAPAFWRESAHNNVVASATTLEGATRSPNLRRYVFASSYLIYDPDSYLVSGGTGSIRELDEQSPVSPRNVTGAAKLLHESELDLATQDPDSAFSAVSARIFRVYGPSSRDVVSRWIRAAVRGEAIEVFGDDGRFDYVLSNDVADGLVRLSNSDASGVVNLGTGKSRQVREVVSILHKQFPDLEVIYSGTSIDPVESSQASMEKCRSFTGWSPPTELEAGIGSLVEHERANAAANTVSRRVVPPKTLNVLVTSASAKTHVPRAVHRAFRSLNVNGTVWAGDTDVLSVAQSVADRFWHMPRLDELPVEMLESFCRQHSIGLVIPTRDGELGYFARHRDRLGECGAFVPIGSPESVELANDKLQFAMQLQEAGLPPILTAEDPNAVDSESLVVKPRFGAGSAASGINVTREAARELGLGMEAPVFQPYLAGHEYSIDTYISRTGRVLGAIARERVRITHGESRVTTVVDDSRLRDLGVACAQTLGVRGHAVVQVIESEAGLHVLECNSRVGGASSAAWSAGLRSVDAMAMEALDEDIGPMIEPRGSLTMSRISIDRIEWS